VALTVDECIGALNGLGYEFSLRDDGSVSVKQPAKRNPRAAEMMNYLALHKEDVRVAVRDWGQRSILPETPPAQVVNPAVAAQQAGAPVDDVAGDTDVLTSAEPENQTVINKGLDKPGGFDQIRAASAVVLPEADAEGIVRMVRVSPEVAFAAGDLVNDGKAELIGQVIYRRFSNVFDVTYRVVEA